MSYGVSSALPLSYGSDPEGMDECSSTHMGLILGWKNGVLFHSAMGLILKGWMMSYGVSSALPLSYGSDPEGMDDVIRGKQRSSTQLWV